jgi:hypothetical protein
MDNKITWSRTRWLNGSFIVLAGTLTVLMFFQLYQRMTYNANNLNFPRSISVTLTDLNPSTVLSIIKPQSDRKWILLMLIRGRNYDSALLDFMIYVVKTDPDRISGHLITSTNMLIYSDISSLDHVIVQSKYFDDIFRNRSVIWDTCLIVFSPEREPIYGNISPSRHDLSSIAMARIFPDLIESCHTGPYSLDGLILFDMKGDAVINLPEKVTHLVFYPSLCSGCGEDMLLKAVESLYKRNIHSEQPNIKLNSLILFPRDIDYSRLTHYLSEELPTLTNYSSAFGRYSLPPADCLRLQSLRAWPMVVKVLESGEGLRVSLRDYLVALEKDIQW